MTLVQQVYLVAGILLVGGITVLLAWVFWHGDDQ